MSALAPDERPACPVHPYGYHRRSHVSTRADEVLSEASPERLPARCVQLERELEESGRVEEFVRQLWVIEREGRPGASLLLVVAAIAVVVIGVVSSQGDGDAVWRIAAWTTAFAAVAVAAEAVMLRTRRRRLRRVYDWRGYVGFHV